MIFLEFCSCLSDVLHGTDSNRWMKIRILDKIDNFDKIQKFSQNLSFDNIWQLCQEALISILIDETKMLEFDANFILDMKLYEIPATLK